MTEDGSGMGTVWEWLIARSVIINCEGDEGMHAM